MIGPGTAERTRFRAAHSTSDSRSPPRHRPAARRQAQAARELVLATPRAQGARFATLLARTCSCAAAHELQTGTVRRSPEALARPAALPRERPAGDRHAPDRIRRRGGDTRRALGAIRRRGRSDEQNLDKLAPRAAGSRWLRLRASLRRTRCAEHVVRGVQRTSRGSRAARRFGSPRFLPDDIPDGRTMAELEPEQKDAISHRGRAARALLELLSVRCPIS